MIKNKILVNIFSNWANLLVVIIVRFLLTPFLIHNLGDEEYGIWILILSIIGYMQMMNLGINTAIIRYISKYVESKEYKEANEIYNTAFFMFLLLAFLIVCVVMVLAWYLPEFYQFSKTSLYKIIFIIVGINLAFEFIFYVLTISFFNTFNLGY